jgi:hypothetical protein
MMRIEDTETTTTETSEADTPPPMKPTRKPAKKARKRKGSSRRTSGRTKAKAKETVKPSPKASAKAGVKTTTRTGKKITRAKPGQDGVLASKDTYLLIVRVPKKIREAAWRKVRSLQKSGRQISMTSWIAGLIERAA